MTPDCSLAQLIAPAYAPPPVSRAPQLGVEEWARRAVAATRAVLAQGRAQFDTWVPS